MFTTYLQFKIVDMDAIFGVTRSTTSAYESYYDSWHEIVEDVHCPVDRFKKNFFFFGN